MEIGHHDSNGLGYNFSDGLDTVLFNSLFLHDPTWKIKFQIEILHVFFDPRSYSSAEQSSSPFLFQLRLFDIQLLAHAPAMILWIIVPACEVRLIYRHHADLSELCDEKEKPCLSSSIPPMGGHALTG